MGIEKKIFCRYVLTWLMLTSNGNEEDEMKSACLFVSFKMGVEKKKHEENITILLCFYKVPNIVIFSLILLTLNN